MGFMMNEELKDLILATYADLCIAWRREVVSCRSNAVNLNEKLTSLEEVMKAFGFAVPGLFDSQPVEAAAEPKMTTPAAEPKSAPKSKPVPEPFPEMEPEPIGEPTTAVYEARAIEETSKAQAPKQGERAKAAATEA